MPRRVRAHIRADDKAREHGPSVLREFDELTAVWAQQGTGRLVPRAAGAGGPGGKDVHMSSHRTFRHGRHSSPKTRGAGSITGAGRSGIKPELVPEGGPGFPAEAVVGESGITGHFAAGPGGEVDGGVGLWQFNFRQHESFVLRMEDVNLPFPSPMPLPPPGFFNERAPARMIEQESRERGGYGKLVFAPYATLGILRRPLEGDPGVLPGQSDPPRRIAGQIGLDDAPTFARGRPASGADQEFSFNFQGHGVAAMVSDRLRQWEREKQYPARGFVPCCGFSRDLISEAMKCRAGPETTP